MHRVHKSSSGGKSSYSVFPILKCIHYFLELWFCEGFHNVSVYIKSLRFFNILFMI
jgi:hypothetical protein